MWLRLRSDGCDVWVNMDHARVFHNAAMEGASIEMDGPCDEDASWSVQVTETAEEIAARLGVVR
jgi:hypothetical protein